MPARLCPALHAGLAGDAKQRAATGSPAGLYFAIIKPAHQAQQAQQQRCAPQQAAAGQPTAAPLHGILPPLSGHPGAGGASALAPETPSAAREPGLKVPACLPPCPPCLPACLAGWLRKRCLQLVSALPCGWLTALAITCVAEKLPSPPVAPLQLDTSSHPSASTGGGGGGTGGDISLETPRHPASPTPTPPPHTLT